MFEILHKARTVTKNRTTYHVGLLQAKAYRLLKNTTAHFLSEHNVTTIEWACLGLLYEAKKGMRSNRLAKELGVEAPFVTSLSTKLKVRGMVRIQADGEDSRAKNISLTLKGTQFVTKTEKEMRTHMKPLISGVSLGDLMSYVVVLEKIVANAEKQKNY